MQTLGEDIVLLALRQDGRFHAGAQLRLALSGAELVQLAATQRVTVEGGRVTVLDPSPTGDAQLDAALIDIGRSRRRPKAADWVARPRPHHLDGYLTSLAAAGVLRPERHKMLGMLPATRWLVADTARRDEARARLDAIALTQEPVEAVPAALGGLVHAVGLDRALYPGREGHAARKRLKLVAERDPASRAVRSALEAAESSVEAAVEASIHAAVTASVHATHHAATHHAGTAHGGGGHH